MTKAYRSHGLQTIATKKRRDFNKARRNYGLVKNDVNKKNLNAKAKEYRKEVNISYSQYQRKCEDDIRRISKTDTRSLWKILNRYSGRGSKDPEVDLNTFFEYLKKK